MNDEIIPDDSQGLSLLDIGVDFRLVPVGKKKLRVQGISAESIFAVFARFPEVRSWLTPAGLKVDDMVKNAPAAIAAVIAACTGSPGNAKAEAVARALPIETQLDIVEAVAALSFKNGFGPFVQRIVALGAAVRSVNYGKAQGTSSPSQSSD